MPIPFHVPCVAARVESRAAVPVTAGGAVETGGAAGIAAVAALGALTVPSGLAAMTLTRTLAFSSATAIVYVDVVAPVMFLQMAPSVERCHW